MENIYVKENGNIVISYNRNRLRDKKNTLIAIGVLFLSILGLCVYSIESIKLIFIAFFIFGVFPIVFLLYLVQRKVDTSNKKIEKKLIFPAMETIIEKDISSFGSEVKELARQYVVYDNDKIVERKFFILLSDGKEVFYVISEIAEYNGIVVLEVDVKYQVK